MSYRTDKLVIDARTDTHTDRQTQATTIPEGQNYDNYNIVLCHKTTYQITEFVTRHVKFGTIQSHHLSNMPFHVIDNSAVRMTACSI